MPPCGLGLQRPFAPGGRSAGEDSSGHEDRTSLLRRPGYTELRERLPRLLEVADVNAEIEERRIDSDRTAHRKLFLGSPTIRIDGNDAEPSTGARRDYGLKCRLYETDAGLRPTPPTAWITQGSTGPPAHLSTRDRVQPPQPSTSSARMMTAAALIAQSHDCAASPAEPCRSIRRLPSTSWRSWMWFSPHKPHGR